MKRIVGAVLLLAATATACADSKVESQSGLAASPTPIETLEPTFDPPLADAIDEGPLSELPPEEWRVTVEDALAKAAFKVILPNHPSASLDNVETVYLTPDRTLVLMQFPRPEAPDEPVRREHLEVAEEVWQYSSEPEKVWEESIENAPLPAKSLYTIDGVVALGVQAHSSKDATSNAFLQFGLNGLDVQISGGESLDLLIEIARSMISQAPRQRLLPDHRLSAAVSLPPTYHATTMLLYFAYGANMDPGQMGKRVPEARAIGPARLDGFRLEFSVYSTLWEGGATNLATDEEAHMWGVLWEIPDDMSGLDAYQGHPTFFRREDVHVQGPDGPVIAKTYRVAHQKAYIRPTDTYLRLLRSAIRIHGLPPEALDILDEAARPPGPSIST